MQEYRKTLILEFNRRKQKNSRYTLRSFAKFLEIDSGSLSAILKNKRPLARNLWEHVANKLSLDQNQTKIFFASLANEFKLHSFDFQETSTSKNMKLIEQYQFQILTEWEYAAVLCLINNSDFKFSTEHIKLLLGVSTKRAEEIFNVLVQSKLVHFKAGRWQPVYENLTTTEDIQSKALQISHMNDLQLAQTKLQNLSVDQREFSSLTFLASSKEVKKMKLWLRKARQEFDKKFEKNKGDQVFILSTQLFPVSKRLYEK